MKRYVALLLALVNLPTAAALLRFDLAGEFEAGFFPPVRGPLQLSYELREGPTEAMFGTATAPDGTTVTDYFVGTEFFSRGVPPFGPEELDSIGTIMAQFGDNQPLALEPFSLSQSISSVAFNVYRYSFSAFVSDELFGFVEYDLLFSPPDGTAYWDRSFVESLGDPMLLLALADIDGASGMFELSQLNILADFDRVSITRLGVGAVPEPGALGLAAVALLALGLLGHGRRRTRSAP